MTEFFLPPTCIKDPRLTTTRDGIQFSMYDFAHIDPESNRTGQSSARNGNPAAFDAAGFKTHKATYSVTYAATFR